MKKIVLAIAAVAAMTFASCGNKANQEAAATDSTATDSVAAVDTTALAPTTKKSLNTLTGQLTQQLQAKDAKGVTTTLATLEATYKALVNAGQLDDAKTYGKAIQNFIAQNAETIKTVASGNTTIASLVDGIKNLPTTAETTAEQAKQAVTDDAVSLAAPYIQKAAAASATAAAAKAALESAPTAAKATAAAAKAAVDAAPAAAKAAVEGAANQAVNTAKTAAENKVNSEVNKAQTKAAEKVEKAQKKANDEVNKAANKALKGLGL